MAVMSATAESSYSELSAALQRNAEHETRLSNIQLLQFILATVGFRITADAVCGKCAKCSK